MTVPEFVKKLMAKLGLTKERAVRGLQLAQTSGTAVGTVMIGGSVGRLAYDVVAGDVPAPPDDIDFASVMSDSPCSDVDNFSNLMLSVVVIRLTTSASVSLSSKLAVTPLTTLILSLYGHHSSSIGSTPSSVHVAFRTKRKRF